MLPEESPDRPGGVDLIGGAPESEPLCRCCIETIRLTEGELSALASQVGGMSDPRQRVCDEARRRFARQAVRKPEEGSVGCAADEEGSSVSCTEARPPALALAAGSDRLDMTEAPAAEGPPSNTGRASGHLQIGARCG